ncbi:MAG: hypothetical protein OEN02_00510 [Gammaproteobacteria bacterium]|nr:hypothetical protein [Gammaproteobacteria bacterium]
MKIFILLLVSLIICGSALADAQLRIKDLTGAVSTISSNGQKARIENRTMPGFAIIDYANSQFMMVDTQRKQVMSMSLESGRVSGADATLDVSLDDKGGGPKIAGYATRKYEFTANGEACGTVYASRQLMSNGEIRAMFESMRGMQQMAGGVAGSMRGLLPPCQRANLQLADAMGSSGVPMRIIDAGGKVISEVLSVDTDKNIDGSHYQLPAGMPIVSMDEQMNQAAGQMQEMMKNMPDMNQMMEQMQQGGGQMTEEMQQQMEKLQQMLQQMQQQ